MSITEDNKESEEQKSSAARKLEACDFKNKGNQFVKIKEHESAIKMYSRAIELNDKDPVFFSNRSQCYLSLEKYKECIEDTKKAIDLDPSSSKSYYRQMVAYEKLGDDFKALKSCRQWLDLSPEDSASKSSYDRIHNRIMEAERKKDKEKIRWSRLGSSAKVVNFINKPPHVASKRSLKKVPVQLRKAHLPFSESLIDKIFNNNTGENNIEPEIDSNPLFKPNFLLSSEPATKVAKLEVKKEKPIEEKKRDDEVNETLKKQEQEKEPLTLELECLHPIPQTGPQFYAVWKELNELDKFLFLKKISENKVEIGKLTGPQLSSEILSEIINIVYKYFKIHKVPYIPMLNKLIKNPEIAMLSMFLENDEKSSKIHVYMYYEFTAYPSLQNLASFLCHQVATTKPTMKWLQSKSLLEFKILL